MADAVIYQSQWSRSYLSPFLKKDGPVILNGCDTSIFNKNGLKKSYSGDPVYLYSRYNKDETKRWEEAWFRYQNVHRQTPKAQLIIVGNYSNEQVEYNFDFFNGENIQYEGVVSDPEEMAQIYRGSDYFMMTYYNDACSNTLIEAICCGMSVVMTSLTGGTPEILQSDPSHFTLERMAKDYMEVFNNV
jgi:glycosyltransferase involved in cell wall biosynthesis